LPDGLFSNQKIPILAKFGGPWNGKCSILYDHLEYFTAIWYNLWPIGIACGHLVYFYVLVCLDQEKSGNPGLNIEEKLF
jgi:hypothetical protein